MTGANDNSVVEALITQYLLKTLKGRKMLANAQGEHFIPLTAKELGQFGLFAYELGRRGQ